MTDHHSLKVSAVIKAPRAKVFAAWTTAETLRKWFAPGSRKPDPAILDVRPGGKFRIIMVGEEDSPVAIGEYREVVGLGRRPQPADPGDCDLQGCQGRHRSRPAPRALRHRRDL
jgi:hypothetical protein